MKSKETSDYEKAITSFRRIDEVTSHKQIYQPLLERLGYSHIVYCHGASERGKDFICLDRDRLGNHLLTVIQIKNERITGKAKSKNSAIGIVNQLNQCLLTRVRHPVTQREELPRRVVLFSSYEIPQHSLAGMGESLDVTLRNCEIVPPTQLIQLIKEHLPRTYAELVYPGENLAAALLSNLQINKELSAIGVIHERELKSFFVNIGVSYAGDRLARIASGASRFAAKGKRFHYPRDLFLTIDSLARPFCAELELPAFFSVVPSNTAKRLPGDSTLASAADVTSESSTTSAKKRGTADLSPTVTFKVGDIDRVLTALERLRKTIEHPDAPDKEVLFDQYLYCVYCLEVMLRYMETRSTVGALSKVKEEEKRPRYGLAFTEIDPQLILSSSQSFVLTGGAGAGKTSLSRVLAGIGLEQRRNCIYFPCSRIESLTDQLTAQIAGYLNSIGAIPHGQNAEDVLLSANFMILDGCDEAASFRSRRLSKEIHRLHMPNPVTISFKATPPFRLQIPLDLRESMKIDSSRDPDKTLIIHSPIHPKDYDRLESMEDNKPYLAVFREGKAVQAKSLKRMFLTSRDLVAMPLSLDYIRLEAMPFTEKQLEEFFRRWFAASNEAFERIWTFVERNAHVRTICKTPMIAMLVAALEENGYDLSKSKTEIYQKRFNLLLEKWDSMRRVPSRSRVSPSDKLRFIARIALMTHRKSRAHFTLAEMRTAWDVGFAHHYPDLAVDLVARELEHSNCVIHSTGPGEYSFGHLSYQEFLSALELVNQQNPRTLVSKFRDTWWRQVLVFYAGIAGTIDRLLKMIHASSPIPRRDPLVLEMLAEARHTPPDLRSFLLS
jgi:hypothetical protein